MKKTVILVKRHANLAMFVAVMFVIGSTLGIGLNPTLLDHISNWF